MADSVPGGLLPRLGSGLVLGVLALLVASLGGIPLAVLIALALALIIHEMDRAQRARGASRSMPVMIASLAALGATLAFAASSWYWLALIAAAGGGMTAAVLAMNRGERTDAAILGGLVVWVAVAGTALLWLRATGGWGVVVWLFVVVWATDTGAYAVGRLLGGPRLAPRLSPGKTWAGALGGAGAGIGIGVAAGWVLTALGGFGSTLDLAFVVPAAALLALTGQFGDLLESAFKRRCGVKDSGALIPGHGGAFDRLDSLLAATPALAVLVYALGPALGNAP